MQAYLYLGIAYLGKGHEAAARARFRDAVTQMEDLTLSPEESPPKVIDLFEAAREDRLKAPAATPSESAPAAAPESTAAPDPAGTAAEAAAPTPTPTPVSGAGSLQLGVRPWAEIAIDGEVVGTTPLDTIPLAAGKHVVRLRHPAYQPVEREVVISADQTERRIFDFTADGTPRRQAWDRPATPACFPSLSKAVVLRQ